MTRSEAAAAEALVAARLGRPPIDEYEAAVVLEAYGGYRAGSAFPAARAIAASARTSAAEVPRPRPVERSSRRSSLTAGFLLPALLAWTPAIDAATGIGEVALAAVLILATPSTMAAVSERYPLAHRQPIGGLTRDLPRAGAVIGAAALAAIAVGGAAPILVALGVAVAGVAVLVHRGWSALALAVVVAAALSLTLGGAPSWTILSAAVVLAVLSAAAARGNGGERTRPVRSSVGPALRQALAGSVVVAAIQFLGVGSDAVALALLPSLFASLLPTVVLERLPRAIRDAAAGVTPIEHPRTMVTLIVVLTVTGIVVLSIPLVIAGASQQMVILLAVIGASTLFSQSLTILESIGLETDAFAAAAVAAGVSVVVAILIASGSDAAQHAASMMIFAAAATIAAALALTRVYAALTRPEVLLATRLWIR